MMSLTYHFINTEPYCQIEKVIINPEDTNIAILTAMAKRPDTQIVNPARTFALKMQSGYYENWKEDDIAAEAQTANILSDAWNNKTEENIFSILGEIARLYVNEKNKTK